MGRLRVGTNKLNNKQRKMSARDFYLKQEAKKDFKDWTKAGLEFLLQRDELQEDVKQKCKKALERLSNVKD